MTAESREVAVTVFGPDPIANEVVRVLERLSRGECPRGDSNETKHVDLKEEAGRRRGSVVGPSLPHNEKAARALTEAAACMANTDVAVS